MAVNNSLQREGTRWRVDHTSGKDSDDCAYLWRRSAREEEGGAVKGKTNQAHSDSKTSTVEEWWT